MDNDQINWNDYDFNFDDEFGSEAAPASATPRPHSGRFSIDELRRLHEGSAATPPPERAPETPEPFYAPEQYAVPQTPAPDAPKKQKRQKKKKKHRFLRFILRLLAVLLVLLLLFAAVLLIFQKMPQTDSPIGTRRDGCCTVLLAGTDESGMRTDTMMLLYIDRPGKQLRLLSLPRDTMVNRDNPVPKLNGAYYANGAEEVGMDYLMDYVKDLVGFRPDGYMLIDLNCFETLVDRMGGVKFEVPMDMYYNDPTQDLYIDLKQGLQRLNGEEAMWLVRFREGYATADLQRMSVQRDFLKEALSQWKKPWNIFRLPAVLPLLMEHTLTDLSWRNLSWLGFSVVLCGTGNLETDTLPGEGAYVNGGAYYVEDRSAAAALVNEKYNPYETEITAYDLHPYGY